MGFHAEQHSTEFSYGDGDDHEVIRRAAPSPAASEDAAQEAFETWWFDGTLRDVAHRRDAQSAFAAGRASALAEENDDWGRDTSLMNEVHFDD